MHLYKKPNDDPVNIKENNRPPSVLQQLSKSEISEISSNKNISNQAIPHYENDLKKSGYNFSLKYTPAQNQDENNQQREDKYGR